MQKETNKGLGLDVLVDWYNQESKPHEAVFSETREYITLPHGTTKKVTTSLDRLMENPVIHWWSTDPESFETAVRRDPELNTSLLSIQELLFQLEAKPSPLLIQALTEKVAEASLVAAPHLPRYIQDQVPTESNQSSNNGISNLERFKSWIKTFSLHNRLTSNQSYKRLEELEEALSDSNSSFSHPLMDRVGLVGRERRFGRQKKELMMTYESMRDKESDVFIVTRVSNIYDPEKGTLSAYAPREQATFYPYYSLTHDITAPIGRVDLKTHEEIAIPWPVFNINRKRYGKYSKEHYLANLTLKDATNDADLLDRDDLVNCIELDGIGNYFLILKALPDRIKQLIDGKKINLIASYYYSFDYMNRKKCQTSSGSDPSRNQRDISRVYTLLKLQL